MYMYNAYISMCLYAIVRYVMGLYVVWFHGAVCCVIPCDSTWFYSYKVLSDLMLCDYIVIYCE